jgi:hypothetical protein
MAIVNISIDTNSRQAILTVDNQIIPVVACRLNKGVDFDGESFLRFGYVVETKNENGLMERREFFLPDEDDQAIIAKKNGLASRILEDGELVGDQAMQDTVKYIENRRK